MGFEPADAILERHRRQQTVRSVSSQDMWVLSFEPDTNLRGAPARAIQELAGHRDLMTTQQYIHLSVAMIDHAIRLLETPKMTPARGDILETEKAREANLNS